jgi:predicted acyl esterase
VAAVLAGLAATSSAAAAPVEQVQRVTASDGVSLRATLTGEAPLTRRPTIVEFTPYGKAGGTGEDVPGFHRLTVEIRGTGDSDGVFDALGPRTQQDVEEVLRWACAQPWSDGKLGLYGFSASAITIYNSLHRKLPCVRAAVLGSGTHELYRDLLVPGGVSNLVPGAGVVLGIGAPALLQGPERLLRNPLSAITTLVGLIGAGANDLLRPQLDDWWRERGMRGDVNGFPMLMTAGFFDVESRGAFQAFQELRGSGARLLVVGAHDAAPKGSDRGAAQRADWYRHYLRGDDNGVERRPKVEMLLADGDRQAYVAGRTVAVDAGDWPVPGTRWTRLNLDATASGSGPLVGDGSMGTGAPRSGGRLAYAALPSIFTATDPPNAAIVGGTGLDAVTAALPVLRDMNLSEQLGRSFTTPPLREDVVAAGPGSLRVRLGTSTPGSAIWAVVSDVSPDGVSHPLTAGRLNTAFPEIDPARSLRDPRTGEVVQPYGRFDRAQPPAQGQERDYQVELWPLGNRFRTGHRIRVTLVGASIGSPLSPPGVQTVDVGRSSLMLPALPGSDLPFALGGPRSAPDPAAGAPAGAAARPRLRVSTSPGRIRAGARVRLRVRVRVRRPALVPVTGGCRAGARWKW